MPGLVCSALRIQGKQDSGLISTTWFFIPPAWKHLHDLASPLSPAFSLPPCLQASLSQPHFRSPASTQLFLLQGLCICGPLFLECCSPRPPPHFIQVFVQLSPPQRQCYLKANLFLHSLQPPLIFLQSIAHPSKCYNFVYVLFSDSLGRVWAGSSSPSAMYPQSLNSLAHNRCLCIFGEWMNERTNWLLTVGVPGEPALQDSLWLPVRFMAPAPEPPTLLPSRLLVWTASLDTQAQNLAIPSHSSLPLAPTSNLLPILMTLWPPASQLLFSLFLQSPRPDPPYLLSRPMPLFPTWVTGQQAFSL